MLQERLSFPPLLTRNKESLRPLYSSLDWSWLLPDQVRIAIRNSEVSGASCSLEFVMEMASVDFLHLSCVTPSRQTLALRLLSLPQMCQSIPWLFRTAITLDLEIPHHVVSIQTVSDVWYVLFKFIMIHKL